MSTRFHFPYARSRFRIPNQTARCPALASARRSMLAANNGFAAVVVATIAQPRIGGVLERRAMLCDEVQELLGGMGQDIVGVLAVVLVDLPDAQGPRPAG